MRAKSTKSRKNWKAQTAAVRVNQVLSKLGLPKATSKQWRKQLPPKPRHQQNYRWVPELKT